VRREIVEDVLPSLGMSPNDIAVSVDRGEVVLSGALDDELQARWLPHAVRCVLGVVAVDSRLEPGHTPVEELVTPGA
jgi:osmotically-inducible protein OsmY